MTSVSTVSGGAPARVAEPASATPVQSGTSGHALLTALVDDLQRRCALIKQRLVDADEEMQEVRDCALHGYREVESARRDALDLAGDPALGDPHLASDFLRRYRRLAEQVSAVEAFVLPVVERFGEEDRFLTRLTGKLIGEVRWPCAAPVVIAFSSNYYWTFLGYNIIAVPAGEARTFLGLPDLCHELAHALHAQCEPILVRTFGDDIDTYIADEQRKASADQQPSVVTDLDVLRARWRDTWLTEFVCDMVATYLVGPAYGGQHVRLAAGRATGTAFFPALRDDAVHPADDARLRGIAAVLAGLGDRVSADHMLSMWSTYVAMSGETEPAEYAICYPQPLMDGLAAQVIAGCRVLGLRSFVDVPPDDTTSVQANIIESWRRFLRDPSGHAAWEAERIARSSET